MPITLKIKQSAQASGSSRPTKTKVIKRRIDSDDEGGDDEVPAPPDDPDDAQPRPKRARTGSLSAGGRSADVNSDGEEEIDVDVDIEEEVDDTRFLPPAEDSPSSSPSPPPTPKPAKRGAPSKAKPKLKASAKTTAKGSAKVSKRKRSVVWTDDEDDDEDAMGIAAVDPDDDDFTPEPALSAAPKNGITTTKARILKNGASKTGKGKAKAEEKEIVIRDERKLPPPAPSTSKQPVAATTASKRPSLKTEDSASTSAADDAGKQQVESPTKTEDPAPALPVKRKLPTIKKNKPPTASSTPTAPKPPPPPQSTSEQKDASPSAKPVGVAARKPVNTLGNADFDLRDKSVYASLFKTGGSTPNSGLNRKEKEEERRRELNRMREEARAKRAEEAKQAFDLQAPAEKIHRFEAKLYERKATAFYPNILGGYFKGIHDRAKEKAEGKERL
ncbi:hypothetical protein WOLCODRAFT_135958 [Wolfiporia cocos MD-104 SS10]|uniref:Uncharacterized protein n=1 Tax=Wolfiporia cocos (strain MD-104) TaxID=742152 RepID=A0A2H3J6S8_WOLCO|nr:hypothetical protein WOLCODRAFT_135958 [Wolfiporia cocos MD-104 SS10]